MTVRQHTCSRIRNGAAPVFRIREQQRAEVGAGTVLAVAIMAAVIAVAALVLPMAVLLDARHRAAAAADAAALAAADVAVGAAPGEPCSTAERIAAEADARITRCTVREATVRIETSVDALGIAIPAAAVAGPPP